MKNRIIHLFLVCCLLVSSTSKAEAPEATNLEKAHAWVLDFLLQSAPPGRKVYYPEGQETEEEALKRYNQVAWDIVDLAYSPAITPVFESEDHGRSQTAAVWLGIMLMESGFMKHVDYNLGDYGRGDSGLSWCMMQLRIGKGNTVPWNTKEDRQPWWGDDPADIFEGHSGDELIADRKLCISEGHHLVRISFKSCKHLPLQDRLTAYAVGKCDAKTDDPDEIKEVEQGRKKSQARMYSAIRYFTKTKHSRGFTDKSVVEELARKQDVLLAAWGG